MAHTKKAILRRLRFAGAALKISSYQATNFLKHKGWSDFEKVEKNWEIWKLYLIQHGPTSFFVHADFLVNPEIRQLSSSLALKD